MRKVQMLEYISGGRHDGTEWPPAGHPLMVPDWEAEDLIRGRLARPWPGGEERTYAEADPSGSAAAASVAADQEHVAGPPPVVPEGVVGPEGSVTSPVPPRPAAPKPEWVAFAVASGVAEDEANAMSKAELMERYGGRA